MRSANESVNEKAMKLCVESKTSTCVPAAMSSWTLVVIGLLGKDFHFHIRYLASNARARSFKTPKRLSVISHDVHYLRRRRTRQRCRRQNN